MNIRAQFEQFRNLDTFSRVDDMHILDLYIGINEDTRKTLFLISETEPKHIASSQMITVQLGKRKDDRWGLSFILADDQFTDQFLHFCEDIIESSRILTSKSRGADFICGRYLKWQEMLARSRNSILLPAEVKGLIGELYYLKQTLIPTWGESAAIDSWIGPENADQGFVFKNKWYEVKSTVSGAESVIISSIEQLDTNITGELIIVFLDKTSKTDSRRITLNNIYTDILDSLSDENVKIKFSSTMLAHGYYIRPEYDEYSFRFSGFSRYIVDSNFPCIRRGKLSSSVIGAKYRLSLAAIKAFESE